MNNNELEDLNIDEPEQPSFTNIRISTMTAISKILYKLPNFKEEQFIGNCCYDKDDNNINEKPIIDLLTISKKLKIPNDYGVKYLQYYTIEKGTKKKPKRKRRQNTKVGRRKVFYNQITLEVQIRADKIVNTKIFTNGQIQMTGLKSKEDGLQIIKIVSNIIRDNLNLDIKFSDLNIVLINSDFVSNFTINRFILHEILVDDKIYATYEPCIYPGVNIKIYFNEWNKKKDYRCYCTKYCNGKGKGNGDGDCKRVSICVFQSGTVIITGASKLNQIDVAYKFITDVFKKNYYKIKKVKPNLKSNK